MLGESITFQSTREINPAFNLLGQTVLQDTINIYMNMSGTLREPVIALYSEPPLPEEDVISLLSFGKLANEVPLAFGDFDVLKDRTLNLAASVLSARLRRKMRLTELELKTGLTGGNPQVTVGLYVSRDLYIRYTHDLLAWDKDVFLMKYFLTRRTALYTERDEDGSLSTGVNFHFRF
jgi:autotransporter translocation and assembly factor TamB